MFNLEINQSGSYVPHGILNWVISKSGLNYDINTLNNYHPNYHQYKIVFMLVDLEAVGSWSSRGCLIELTSPPSLSILITQPIFMLFRFNCNSLLHKKWTYSFCYFFIMKQRQKNKVNKQSVNWSAGQSGQQMQNINMYPPVSLRIAWNAWQKTICKGIYSFKLQSFHTHFKPVSTQVFFSIIACCFGSTAVLIYEQVFQ